MIDANTLHLAHIIAGEAGGCGFIAMLAVANIWTRNKRMNGYAPITAKSLYAALVYDKIEDVTGGARFLFSCDDLQLKSVRNIIAVEGRASPIIYCNNKLFAY